MRSAEIVAAVGWDEESRIRRASHRESSAKVLADHGISFESKNDGAHLIVKHGDNIADFWPGTGKFIIRGSAKYGRGVFNLLKRIGVAK